MDVLGGQYPNLSTRGVPRGEGGHNASSAISLEAPKNPNNVASTLFHTVHLLPKDLKIRTWGRQTCFLPRAPSNAPAKHGNICKSWGNVCNVLDKKCFNAEYQEMRKQR